MEPLSLVEIWAPLRCYKWLIAAVTVLSAIGGYAYGASQIPQFTSFASVLIQPQRGDTAKVAEAIGAGLEMSSGALEAETRLIHSPKFVSTLIDELDLRSHPDSFEFNAESEAKAGLIDDWLEQARGLWTSFAGSLGYASHDDGIANPNGRKESVESIAPISMEADADTAYDAIEDTTLLSTMDRLTIESEPDAFLISIGYSSSDPRQSARVTNHAAKLYVQWKLEDKLLSVDAASARLQKSRLTVERELIEAESEVERFKQDNNLLSTEQGSLLIDDELIAAKSGLSTARADLAAERARHNLLLSSREGNEDLKSIADRNITERLVELESQRTSLLQTMAETSITLGPKHPRMISLNAEIGEIERKLNEELDRIIAAQGTNVKLAQERVASFEQELARLRAISASDHKNQIQLRELQRKVDAKRELYQSLITRHERIDQERDAIKADARIVSNALVPEGASTPSPITFALMGFVGSLSMMTLLVLLREHFRSGFTRLRDIENVVGLRVLGVVPQIENKKGRALWRTIKNLPSSMFVEAFAKIHTTIMLNRKERDKGAIILVTSSLPSEGKTTLSCCLAAFAAHADQNQRVIVVDLDFRRPTIKREFGQSVKWGLVEYLSGVSKLTTDDIVRPTDQENLDYLPIKMSSRDSTLLINSEPMRHLLQELCQDYDLIVLDCPPVLVVNDTKIAAKWADACLFAVKWSGTAKETVKTAVNELVEVDVPDVGIVFTQAKMKRFINYNYNYSYLGDKKNLGRYGNQYENE